MTSWLGHGRQLQQPVLLCSTDGPRPWSRTPTPCSTATRAHAQAPAVLLAVSPVAARSTGGPLPAIARGTTVATDLQDADDDHTTVTLSGGLLDQVDLVVSNGISVLAHAPSPTHMRLSASAPPQTAANSVTAAKMAPLAGRWPNALQRPQPAVLAQPALQPVQQQQGEVQVQFPATPPQWSDALLQPPAVELQPQQQQEAQPQEQQPAPQGEQAYAPGVGAHYEGVLPPRSWSQQHNPPSAPSPSGRMHPRPPAAAPYTTAKRSWTSSPSSSSSSISSGSGAHSGGYRSYAGAGGPPATLTAQLAACSNWYEVRAMLASSPAALAGQAGDPAAVLAVLQRLVAVVRYRMQDRERAQFGAWLDGWLLQQAAPAAGAPRAGAPTAALPLSPLAACCPAQASLLLHALAQLGHAPAAGWLGAWLAHAAGVQQLARFRPKDLSLSLWAAGKLRLALPQQAVDAMLEAAEPLLPRFNAQDLANTALALSSLGARPPPAWQRRFLARSLAALPTFNAQGLCNLIHGLAHTPDFELPEPFLDAFCAAAYAQLPACRPQGLSNLLGALAACRYAPGAAWLERFWAESQPLLPRCLHEDLTGMAIAASRLPGVAPPGWWAEALGAELALRMASAGARQLSDHLRSLALLQRAAAATGQGSWPAGGGSEVAAPPPPPQALVRAWVSAAADPGRLERFSPVDVANSVWSMAVLGMQPDAGWLQRLLIHMRPSLPACPPGHLALMLWSLAALRYRPTWSWLHDCMEAAAVGLPRMNGQDLAMLMSAIVRLACRPSADWVAGALVCLQPRLEGLPPHCLAQVCWALYKLRVQPPPAWIEVAADAARYAFERGDMALRDSSLLLWALSRWLGVQRVRVRRRSSSTAARRRAGHSASGTCTADGSIRSSTGSSSSSNSGSSSRRMRTSGQRPGHLAASLGNSLAAAAAFRRRVAGQLLPAALAASEPQLGSASPQDVALLASALGRLSGSGRRALRLRPGWACTFLEASERRWSAMSSHGLQLVLCGTAALCMRPSDAWCQGAAGRLLDLMQRPSPIGPHLASLRALGVLCRGRLPDVAAGAMGVLVRRDAAAAQHLAAVQLYLRRGVQLQRMARAGLRPSDPAWVSRNVQDGSSSSAGADEDDAEEAEEQANTADNGDDAADGDGSTATIDVAPAWVRQQQQQTFAGSSNGQRRAAAAAAAVRRAGSLSEAQRKYVWARTRRQVAACRPTSPVQVLQLATALAAMCRQPATRSAGGARPAAAAAANNAPQRPALVEEHLLWLARLTAAAWPKMLACHRGRLARAWSALWAAAGCDLPAPLRAVLQAALPPECVAAAPAASHGGLRRRFRLVSRRLLHQQRQQHLCMLGGLSSGGKA